MEVRSFRCRLNSIIRQHALQIRPLSTVQQTMLARAEPREINMQADLHKRGRSRVRSYILSDRRIRLYRRAQQCLWAAQKRRARQLINTVTLLQRSSARLLPALPETAQHA